MTSQITVAAKPGSSKATQTVEEQQKARLDEKLRRELGREVLEALASPATEDVCLNTDGKLWVNEQRKGWRVIGTMQASQASAAMGTIATIRETAINHDRPILETELPIVPSNATIAHTTERKSRMAGMHHRFIYTDGS